ncbi:MAG: hypothetical protein ACWA47_05750 [Brevirhabdus sp.]
MQVTPKHPSRAVGIDVYGKDRARGQTVPRFRGQEVVQVRTRGKGESGSFTELSGVSCMLDSGLYSARFTSPANVVVPDYGPSSPAIFVRCVNGETSGSVTVNAFNATHAQNQSAAYGTGVLGAIVIGAVAAANRDDEKDDFKYPVIYITLK